MQGYPGSIQSAIAARAAQSQASRLLAGGVLSATTLICLLGANASPVWAQDTRPPRRRPVKDPLAVLNDEVRQGTRLAELLAGRPKPGVLAASPFAPGRSAVPRFEEVVDLDTFTPRQRQALQRAWNGLPEFAQRQAGELVGEPQLRFDIGVNAEPRSSVTGPGSPPSQADSGSNIGGLSPLPRLSSSLPGELSAPASPRPGITGHQDFADAACYCGTHIQLHRPVLMGPQEWAEARRKAEKNRSWTSLQRVKVLTALEQVDMVRQLPGGLERVLYHELMHAYQDDNSEQVDEFLAIRHRDIEARIQEEEPGFMARLARESQIESAFGLANFQEEAARVAEKYNLLRRGKEDNVYTLRPNEYFAIATSLWRYDPERARAQLSAEEMAWLDGFFARHGVNKPDRQRADSLGARAVIKRELDR